jgi:hypothetical protein
MPPADIARLGRVDGKILPFSATGCEPLPIRYLEQDMPNILAGDTGRARASGIAIALLALGSVSAAAEGCATHVTFHDGCRATDTCGGKAGQAGTGAGYGGVNASWGAGTTSSGGASGSHTATNGGGSAETSTAAGAAGESGEASTPASESGGLGASGSGAGAQGGRDSTDGASGHAGGGFAGNQSGNGGATSAGAGGMGGVGSTSPYPIQVAIGSLRMCALISDGRVYCWGRFPLGNGTTNDGNGSATPVQVTGITSATQLSGSAGTFCVLLADDSIRCWGEDDLGQASGEGVSASTALTPVPVGGLTGVSEVFGAGWLSCALLSNGVVRCWGGSSDSSSQATATPITTISPLGVATHLGGDVCAVLADQTVKCWYGVLGTPSTQAGLPANITQITSSCALSSDGSVRCWGPGGQGQIGNGLTDDQTTPQVVQRLGTATWIGSSNDHVCAMLLDQSFSCWGKDGFFDAVDYGPYPLPIAGLDKVTAAAVGEDNTCVIETDHSVKYWGSNLSGYQLGPNGPESNSATPITITGLPGGG